MELLERDRDREVLHTAIAESRSTGRIAVITGEPGIGKTVLVTAVIEAREERVLWGACDPLFTPSPLGPLLEVAEASGGELKAVVKGFLTEAEQQPAAA